MKDAAGDVAGSANLRATMPAAFEIYSGTDDQTLALLAAAGAVGVVSVAAHWAGPQIAEMIAAFEKGDVTGACELNARLLPSWEFEGTDAAPNPIPSKTMMRVLGHAVGECRLPMGPTPAGLEDRAREVLAALRG